jgi:hypothetical protein
MLRIILLGGAECPPNRRRRAACAASFTARAGAQVTLRVHFGARGAFHHCRLRPYGGAGRDRGQAWLQRASADATARLRLRVGQQGARHAGAAGLSRAQKHPAYGALHRAIAVRFKDFWQT